MKKNSLKYFHLYFLKKKNFQFHVFCVFFKNFILCKNKSFLSFFGVCFGNHFYFLCLLLKPFYFVFALETVFTSNKKSISG